MELLCFHVFCLSTNGGGEDLQEHAWRAVSSLGSCQVCAVPWGRSLSWSARRQRYRHIVVILVILLSLLSQVAERDVCSLSSCAGTQYDRKGRTGGIP